MSEADEDMNTSVNGDRFVEHIKLLHGQQLKTQTKTFTKWMNSHLRQHEPPLTVEDLFKDIKDGTRLLGLLEVLSGERLVGERGANMKRIHFLTNVNQALNFLQSKNIKLVNINTGDVVDGRPAVVLGLIWTIILYFHIEKGTRELLERKRADSVLAPVDGVAESEKQTKEEEVKSAPAPNVGARATLLSWASDAMERHPDIEVKNFGPSWRDGRAFNGLVHNVKPEIVDMAEVVQQPALVNLEQAFEKAETELGIHRLIDPEDVDVEKPDEKSIMTYVGQFLDKYPDAGKPVAKLETAKENGTEETDGSDEFEKLEAPVEEALVSSVAADSFLAAPPSDTVYSNKEEEEEKEEEKEEEEEEEDHATVMGVEFAPMNIPLERRLQTAVVIHIVATFMFASFGSIFFCIYLLLCTRYWWLVLIYISWMLFDRDSCNRGGRRSEWVRNWPMWEYYRDYFPITLRRTAELDPNRNYVFGYHPHGIMGVGAFCNFGLNGKYFLEKFPGIKPYLLTLEGLFWFPFFRDYIMSSGVCSVSKESIEWILTKEGKGNAAVIIVGGAVEALEAHPGGFNVKLKTRKGFVKMALKHGASLVPVYSFGENDVFDQTENPEGSLLRNIQNVLTKYLGFAPPIFHGRGVFNYTFGLLPFRKPVTTIVGKPIDLEKVEEPDNELVDKTHDIYTRALCRLFDDHKAEFGIPEETTLTIV